MSSMTITANEPSSDAEVQLTNSVRRALIERVAASPSIKRAARLRDFLLFVGYESLKEGRGEIHESEIGARVFGRPDSYDRSHDNIVRVNATELRKRVELYFSTEGANEPIVFSIPRGSYSPVFQRRPAEGVSFAPVEENRPSDGVVSDETPVPGAHVRVHLLWGAICVLLLGACAALYWTGHRVADGATEGKEPTVRRFWENFLANGRETDIVLPDASVFLGQEITGRAIPLANYIEHDYLHESADSKLSVDQRRALAVVFGSNLVTLGDFRAAQQVLSVPWAASGHLTDARFYSAEALKRNNVILIGGERANPWEHLFNGSMNFGLDYGPDSNTAIIQNRTPRAGEQSQYEVSLGRNAPMGYSIVAYMPNPGGGNAIVLEGTDSDATNAAAEFITSEQQLHKLQVLAGVPKLTYFEVLLKTSLLSGASFSSEIVAYRIR